MTTDWAALTADTLSKLDIRAEAETMGVRFSSGTPSSAGWLECFAVDRDEQKPSAAVNVASDNGILGRYTDLGSGNKSISFFDLAVKLGRFSTWQEARNHFMEKAGISLPKNKGRIGNANGNATRSPKSKPLDKHVKFLDPAVNPVMSSMFSQGKPGVTPDAMAKVGARFAKWPTDDSGKPTVTSFTVVVFTAFRPPDWSHPSAFVLYCYDGKEFPAVGKKLPKRKTHLPSGSRDGLLIVGSRADLETAVTVWLCEGMTDALSVSSILPAGNIAVTNSHGALTFDADNCKSLRGKRVMICMDADKAGEDGAEIRAQAVVPVACETRRIRLPYSIEKKHGKDLRDWIGAGGTFQDLERIAAESPVISTEHVRRTIIITPDEHIHIAEAIESLSGDLNTFTRGGQLVDVIREKPQVRNGVRLSTLPIIVPTPLPRLRTRLTARAQFVKVVTHDGEESQIPVHPPEWIVKGVSSAGEWSGIRHLEAVVTSPVLRQDGSILQTPGYDPSTGILYEPSTNYPTISDRPTKVDIDAAVRILLEVVQDFPFHKSEHRAAWLAATLTILARFAFHGPAPLFLFDANTPGSGKGLLVLVLAIIATGEEVATATFTRDDNEMRKIITSIAIGGERVVLWDNVAGTFGGANLDAAITSTKWKGRVLGVSQTVELPLNVTWLATGNNIILGSDMPRRVCHIRLNSPVERPEERDDFAHRNLQSWVRAERVQLLSAALTILRGFVIAGCPDMKLKPWGSFEGWSALVRNCVVWCGLDDPGSTRNELAKQTDTAAGQLRGLLHGWLEVDSQGRGLTTAQVFETLKSGEFPMMRAALNDCCTGPKGEPPTSRALSYKLRHFRKRVVDGLYFDTVNENMSGMVWAVHGHQGDNGDRTLLRGCAGAHTHTHAGGPQ